MVSLQYDYGSDNVGPDVPGLSTVKHATSITFFHFHRHEHRTYSINWLSFWPICWTVLHALYICS